MRNLIFKILTAFSFITATQAQLLDVEKAGLSMLQNIINNPGFESALAGWTSSGGTFTLDTTNFAYGKASGSWDSSASAQTLRSKQITIPSGLFGKNIVFGCMIKTPSGSATHQIGLWDGTTETNLTTITSATTFTRTIVNTIAPSSGTLGIELKSVNANEPAINIDDCFIADANMVNLSQVNQATVVGTLKYTGQASCGWPSTNASMTSITADGACASPSVTGTAVAPGTKIPAVVFNNLQPGIYELTAQAVIYSPSSGNLCVYELYDGTSRVGNSASYNGSSDALSALSLSGTFEYTTVQSSKTFEIRALRQTGAGSCSIQNDVSDKSLTFVLKRFPSQSELAFRPEQQAVVSTLKYPQAANCGWTTTSATMASFAADADCTTAVLTGNAVAPGTKLVNVTVNNLPAGNYLVQAQGLMYASVNGTTCMVELYDGTSSVGINSMYAGSSTDLVSPISLSGIFSYTSSGNRTFEIRGVRGSGAGSCIIQNDVTSKSLTISVIPVNPAITAPLLVGSVTSGNAGALRIEGAELNCDASSAITSQTYSSFVATIGNRSTTSCAITFTAGAWASAPYCTFSTKAAANSSGVTVTSTTAGTIFGPSADYDGYLLCVGSR